MERFLDYDGFVNKFKPKLTTDDCYTPPYIYEAVLKFVKDKCNVPVGARILRPFYPGGDYENYDYREGDVVIDNPPFSIVTRIRRFYQSRGIRFFLFAPHLQLFSAKQAEVEKITFIVAYARITYENGAHVPTDFITNMWQEDDLIVVSGELNTIIKEAIDTHKKGKGSKTFPKYSYPQNLVTSAHLGKIAERGIDLNFPRKECLHVSRLDSQIPFKKGIYGNGYLISERLAAERLAAERLAAERHAAGEILEFPLSEREKEIIRNLGK